VHWGAPLAIRISRPMIRMPWRVSHPPRWASKIKRGLHSLGDAWPLMEGPRQVITTTHDIWFN
jgi:hypothetical protein